jgi:hypothetical protein
MSLTRHVTFEIESIDRMYLNVYQPRLQYPKGAAVFFHYHRGHTFASSALMAPMTRTFVAAIHDFIDRRGLDLVNFVKGQRKDDLTQSYLAEHDGGEAVLYVGRAQEKAGVMRTERRYDPRTGASYAWLVKASALVNHFYFYCFDDDFGPFFLKFCSYFPYNAKLCINGHEWAKRQAAKKGAAVRSALRPPNIRSHTTLSSISGMSTERGFIRTTMPKAKRSARPRRRIGN